MYNVTEFQIMQQILQLTISAEKLKIRGNVNVQCNRVPDNAADIAVDN